MEEYTAPLTLQEVHHLLRRTSFGVWPEDAKSFVGMTARQVVDSMVTSALVVPMPQIPSWADEQVPPRTAPAEVRAAFNTNNALWRNELIEKWILQMSRNRLRERLTLFWHDHFVTSYANYFYSAYGQRYLQTLRTHALGNFREFVHAIGQDGAMLIYLDGRYNQGSAPNENYARELMELFTMGPTDALGQPNYTEGDVREVAKALTGWVLDAPTWGGRFDYVRFDDGPKTIFGKTGDFTYDDVISLLFEERAEQIAYFLARKLVVEFVYREPNEDLVALVASKLLSANFELIPALKALFTSTAFFDPGVRGGRPKSPAEFCVGHFVDLGIQPVEENAIYVRRALPSIAQSLLNPPNVAGWPGQRDWITTNTMSVRWAISDSIVRSNTNPEDILSYGSALTPVGSSHPSIDLALAIASSMFAVPLEWIEVPDIEEPFEGDLATFPLPEWLLTGPEYQRNLVKIFLNGLPWYEWNLSIGGASDRLVHYIVRLSQFPEYQLM